MTSGAWRVIGNTVVNNYVDFEKILSVGGVTPTLSKTLWALSEISTDSANPTIIGTITSPAINLVAYIDATTKLLYLKYSAGGNNYNAYIRTTFC